MFTASHNLTPDCGIKYISDHADSATPEITDTIVANIKSASNQLPSRSPSGSIGTCLLAINSPQQLTKVAQEMESMIAKLEVLAV